jgi:hypothetical protein
MQVKIIASDLVNTLVPLQYGVPKAPTLQQSDCVIFQDGKAYTFSGDVFAITDCDFPLTGAVNYQQIVDVFRKYGDALVDVEAMETALVVKKSRSKTTLPYEPDILLSLAALETPDPNEWKDLPSSFPDAVRACESVATKVKMDEVLSSINITETCMEAASTSQIIRHNCDMPIQERFLVRSGILGGLLKSIPEYYQVINNWLFLKSATTVYAVPIYKDSFIDELDSYLAPGDNKVIFPKDLLDDIPLIRSVLDKGVDVTVSLKEGKCELFANGVRGNHVVDADMVSPVDFSFNINPDLLQRILTEFPECTVSDAGIRVQTPEYQYSAAITNK